MRLRCKKALGGVATKNNCIIARVVLAVVCILGVSRNEIAFGEIRERIDCINTATAEDFFSARGTLIVDSLGTLRGSASYSYGISASHLKCSASNDSSLKRPGVAFRCEGKVAAFNTAMALTIYEHEKGKDFRLAMLELANAQPIPLVCSDR